MGSVRALYRTGDNDPELEPEQYYRHYLYCDACGSFDLVPWIASEKHERVETIRRRLAKAAIVASSLVVAAGWEALGAAPPLAFLEFLIAGSFSTLLLLGLLWRFAGTGPLLSPKRLWSFIVLPFLVFPGLFWLEWTSFAVVDPWIWLVAGGLLIAGQLVARASLAAHSEHLGLRCRPCGATYAYGSPLFTDLDANPRNLTVDQVPRPLGSSPFERGASVDDEPPDPPSRLPT